MEHKSSAIDKRALILYMCLIAAAALGNGFSDSIYANYFDSAYAVTEIQRGFIEFPRELPGLLCAAAIAVLSSWGDLRAAILAQVLAFVGVLVLGLFTPPFAVMLVFLFINSAGMHLFMPLSDSIGMSLAEKDMTGRRMGQYASLKSVAGMAAGAVVFFGFRSKLFHFNTPANGARPTLVFLVGAAAFAVAIVLSILLLKRVGSVKQPRKPFKLVFRKRYKYYYGLTILHGVQKQIAYVYGSWVIIRLLGQGADTMALLGIVASFCCIFFMNLVGRWMDKFGIKRMMYLDALTFIVIYVIYGTVVLLMERQFLPTDGIAAIMVYALFVLDRLSMQIGVVKSIYLRDIAVSLDEVTATLSTGTSLDHVVSIIAASVCGLIWTFFGSHWVFYMAAAFSLGNLYIAWRIKPVERVQA